MVEFIKGRHQSASSWKRFLCALLTVDFLVLWLKRYMTAHAKIPFTEHANLLIGGTTAWHVVEVGFLKSNLFLNQFVGCKFSTIFVKTGQDIPQILTHLRLWGFYEIRNISFVTSQSVTATEIFTICWLQTRFSQEPSGTTKKPQTIC